MAARKPTKPKRQNFILRLSAGDEVKITAPANRRVRVSADQGVVVKHVKGER